MEIPDADCSLCPRLAAFRADNAAAFPDWHNAPVPSFGAVNDGLRVRGVAFREAGLASIPTQRTAVSDVATATRLLRLIDALEDNEDVQEVFSNEVFGDDVVLALEEQ